MSVADVLSTALPIVYIMVCVALIVFLIELVSFLKTTKKTLTDLKTELDPTLQHIQSISASLEPAMTRVDPLLERVSLTVDAANLEVMRVDQILENVTEITDGVTSAVGAIDTAANAPMKLVSTASEKVRGVFRTRKASNESIALGNAGAHAKACESANEEAAAQGSAATASVATASAATASVDKADADTADVTAQTCANKASVAQACAAQAHEGAHEAEALHVAKAAHEHISAQASEN